jgi:hypothetical protein
MNLSQHFTTMYLALKILSMTRICCTLWGSHTTPFPTSVATPASKIDKQGLAVGQTALPYLKLFSNVL